MKENDELHYPNVFFNETQKGKWHPRTIAIDTDPGVIDNLRSSKLG